MASVFVGEHKVLGHRVAIKVLHARHLENDVIGRRFFNEAKAVAGIRHSSIVELFDFGRAEDGRAYMVMELLHGETLRARMRRGMMAEREAAIFTRQIAGGLAKAHDAGIVHRDLKPDNIFLVEDPEVELGERAKVLDFGIAKQVVDQPPDEKTATGILVGTPAYMSPEQCRGAGDVDERSDVYSLGVVLYRMVTQKLPFEAERTGELIGKHLYIPPVPPEELNPTLSADLSAVVLRCLEKEPGERFQSMGDLVAALHRLPRLNSGDEDTSPSVTLVPAPTPTPTPVPAGGGELGTQVETAPMERPVYMPPATLGEEVADSPPSFARFGTGRRRGAAVVMGAVAVIAAIALVSRGGNEVAGAQTEAPTVGSASAEGGAMAEPATAPAAVPAPTVSGEPKPGHSSVPAPPAQKFEPTAPAKRRGGTHRADSDGSDPPATPTVGLSGTRDPDRSDASVAAPPSEPGGAVAVSGTDDDAPRPDKTRSTDGAAGENGDTSAGEPPGDSAGDKSGEPEPTATRPSRERKRTPRRGKKKSRAKDDPFKTRAVF